MGSYQVQAGCIRNLQDVYDFCSKSLARMTSFNKHNVGLFQDNLQSVIEKYAFTADRINNCDETGVTTVQKPTRKITEKGVKQVGTVVSQDISRIDAFFFGSSQCPTLSEKLVGKISHGDGGGGPSIMFNSRKIDLKFVF